jgi:hypothetical protein
VGVVPTPEPPRRLSMESALSRIELVGQCAGIRDPHRRRPFQRRAVCVQRWPVHHGVAGSAMPTGVSTAAVSEAGDVADEDLIRSELVPVRAACRRMGDPIPGRRLYQLAQHNGQPMAVQNYPRLSSRFRKQTLSCTCTPKVTSDREPHCTRRVAWTLPHCCGNEPRERNHG